jgi:hypothetical protein
MNLRTLGYFFKASAKLFFIVPASTFLGSAGLSATFTGSYATFSTFLGSGF